MKEILDFRSASLRYNEFFGFLTKVKEATKTITVEADQPAIQKFIAAYDAFDEVLKKDTANSHTAELRLASETMNNTWRGLKKQSHSMTSFSNEERKNIAIEAYHIIERYGELSAMGYNDKSAAAHNILQDFAIMGAEKQRMIGIEIWINELDANYVDFMAAIVAQAAEADERGKGLNRRLRDEADAEYRMLVKRVNSAAFLNGEEPYKEFIGLVNIFIEDERVVLAARKTRSENKKNDEDGTVVDPDLPVDPPVDPDLPAE